MENNIKQEKLKRIKILTIELNKAIEAYDEGHPYITDKQWDDMYFELESLEKECNFFFRNSPTQKVVYQTITQQEKVKHSSPMLSLAKTKDFETFSLFCGGSDSVTSLKLDGLSLRLTYVDGKLQRAETRGNGEVGNDVTYLVPAFKNIPPCVIFQGEYIIEGEAIITKEDFLTLDGYGFKNQRNAAAGSLNLLDANEVAKRHLTFVAWKVVTDTTGSYSFNLDNAAFMGFTVVPYIISNEPITQEWIDELKETAEKKGYPIDGLVQTFDDVNFGLSLGMTEHHPKHSLAYKFYDETYETELIDIEYDVSRLGVLTPVAVFNPIDIDGSEVSRATLNNLSILQNKLGTPYKGQKLEICKRNQVIPYVESASREASLDVKDYILLPDKCPVCGGALEIRESDTGVENFYCTNDECPRKLNQRINHYCDRKKGLDVRGLSLATIEKLIDLGWLNNIIDIYSLKEHRSEWIKLTGFGEKSVDKILNAIEESKLCKLENFISALGIPLVGLKVAKNIVEYYPTWNDFKDAVGGSWSDLPGFGVEMERSLNNFDYSEADKIAEMLVFGTPEVQTERSDNPLPALNICVTGKLGLVWSKRDDLVSFVESKGSKVTSTVTSKTNYLVCNQESNSSKYQKAKELGIPIITEVELQELFS
jgi:DNA ligase (NAD+)